MSSQKDLRSRQKKKRRPFYNFCYDFVKITGAIPILLWMRPKFYYPFGKPKTKGALLVSANHRSMLDPIVVHTVFPWRRLNCLATKDLYSTKTRARFFNQMHCIEVDKENFSLNSFHAVVSCLDEGKVVVIFPEGGLNYDRGETIHAFKSGAVLMAHKAGAPILPLYLVKPDKWYRRYRIVVGQPFNVRESVGAIPSMQDLTRASELLRDKEVELREYFEGLPIYKKIHAEAKAPDEEERTELSV